jgi:hypothetical protein
MHIPRQALAAARHRLQRRAHTLGARRRATRARLAGRLTGRNGAGFGSAEEPLALMPGAQAEADDARP